MDSENNEAVSEPPKPKSSFTGELIVWSVPPLYSQLSHLIEQMEGFFDHIGKRVFVEPLFLHAVAAELVKIVHDDPKTAVSFLLNNDYTFGERARNAVCTAILSLAIADELFPDWNNNNNLALSSLVHDAGMLRLPLSVQSKQGMLSDTERALLETHVVYGYLIAKQELRLNEIAAIEVLQHHERMDGDGYTQKLRGNNIDAGARIISVSDAFDAMINKKTYRNSMSGYEAMRNLLSDNSTRFDPDVLHAFVKIMGIYPVGQEVLLNDGSTARVVDARPSAPLRPAVVITQGQNGEGTFIGKRLDLLNQPGLYIMRAL